MRCRLHWDLKSFSSGWNIVTGVQTSFAYPRYAGSCLEITLFIAKAAKQPPAGTVTAKPDITSSPFRAETRKTTTTWHPTMCYQKRTKGFPLIGPSAEPWANGVPRVPCLSALALVLDDKHTCSLPQRKLYSPTLMWPLLFQSVSMPGIYLSPGCMAALDCVECECDWICHLCTLG